MGSPSRTLPLSVARGKRLVVIGARPEDLEKIGSLELLLAQQTLGQGLELLAMLLDLLDGRLVLGGEDLQLSSNGDWSV
jgi:hypothetical protein